MTKADKVAAAIIIEYVKRYELNRPQGSAAFPSLTQDNIIGSGLSVYNTDGGGTIATFDSKESARAAIVAAQRDYETRTGRPWYQR